MEQHWAPEERPARQRRVWDQQVRRMVVNGIAVGGGGG